MPLRTSTTQPKFIHGADLGIPSVAASSRRHSFQAPAAAQWPAPAHVAAHQEPSIPRAAGQAWSNAARPARAGQPWRPVCSVRQTGSAESQARGGAQESSPRQAHISLADLPNVSVRPFSITCGNCSVAEASWSTGSAIEERPQPQPGPASSATGWPSVASPPAGTAHRTPSSGPWQQPAPPPADERRAEAASTSAAWHATSLALPQSSFESVDLSNGSRPGDSGAGNHGSAAQPDVAAPAVLPKQGGHGLYRGAQQEVQASLSAPAPKQEAPAGYRGAYEEPQAALAEAVHASYPLQGLTEQLEVQQAQAGHQWPPSEAGSDSAEADQQEQGPQQVLKGWGVSRWARGKVWQSEHLQRALRGAAAAASKAGAALAPPPGPLSASSAASTPGSHRSAAQQPLAELSAAVGNGLLPEAHREVPHEPGSATARMAESVSSSGSLAAPGPVGLVSSWLDKPATWGTQRGSSATAVAAQEGPLHGGQPPVAGSRAGAGSVAGMFDRFRLGWAQPEGEEADDEAAEDHSPLAQAPAEAQADAPADAWAGNQGHAQPDAEDHAQNDAQIIPDSGAAGLPQPQGERWQQQERSGASGALATRQPKGQEPQTVVDGGHLAQTHGLAHNYAQWLPHAGEAAQADAQHQPAGMASAAADGPRAPTKAAHRATSGADGLLSGLQLADEQNHASAAGPEAVSDGSAAVKVTRLQQQVAKLKHQLVEATEAQAEESQQAQAAAHAAHAAHLQQRDQVGLSCSKPAFMSSIGCCNG